MFRNHRVILHIDMDAFFASVEQKANPKLRGQPIVVIGQKKRTVILTASYEARHFGIKTGMRVPEAQKLCPYLILVEADQAKYVDTSTRIYRLLKDFSPWVEVYSVDEMFLDMTRPSEKYSDVYQQACLIKKRIRQTLGLNCSVGIAPNKMLAKLASDRSKPNGLTVLTPKDVKNYLENLEVSEICGIGTKTERALKAYGIRTCGQLGRVSVGLLRYRFGVMGELLHQMGCGIDQREVIPLEDEGEAKSVGHSMTLSQDISSREEICRYLLELSEKVGRRLRKANFCAKGVTLTIRYQDFSTFSVQHQLPEPVRCSHDIFEKVKRIFDGVKLKQAVRLLGVSVYRLALPLGQMHLWNETQKKEKIQKVCDQVNDIYGEFSVLPALLLERSHHPGVISPAWRPDGVRRVEFS